MSLFGLSRALGPVLHVPGPVPEDGGTLLSSSGVSGSRCCLVLMFVEQLLGWCVVLLWLWVCGVAVSSTQEPVKESFID